MHIFQRKSLKRLRCFCLDLTAKQTSKMTNLNRNTKIDTIPEVKMKPKIL